LKILHQLTIKGIFFLIFLFIQYFQLFYLILREEAQAKMVLMRDKEDKDKVQLNAELKELIRVIDHDKKLKEFMKIKTQERQEDEELVTWRKKKGIIILN
jgi:hypothetical protein